MGSLIYLLQGFQGKMGPPGPPGVVGPQVSFFTFINVDKLYTLISTFTSSSHLHLFSSSSSLIILIPPLNLSLLSFLDFNHLSLHPSLHPLRVHQARPAPWASVATPDPQAHLESRDFLVHQARRALREILDHQEAPERTGPQD